MQGKWFFTLVVVMGIICTPVIAEARSKTVTVTIPEFPVTVNGQVIENTYNEYPLLVYNNTTYFPVTYDNSKFLGIKMSWYDYEKRHIFFIGRDHDRTIEYVYNSDGYAGYPPFTLDDHYTFVFKKRGFPEKVFSMKKQLSDGDYFFNSDLKAGLVRPENEMLARLEGNILVIRCEKVHKGINEELLLKIDLEAEEIISAQPYVLKK